MQVSVSDGRRLELPLKWYPRLANATEAQRLHYTIETPGDAVHWPDVDEDLHLAGMLQGIPSPEYRRQNPSI